MKKAILFPFFFLIFSFFTFLSAQTDGSYQLSTHILDIHEGKPATGVTIILYKYNEENREFEITDMGKTDENGRVNGFLPSTKNNEGIYKLMFETAPYFVNQQVSSIYPYIEVIFRIEGKDHYHIPITVSANGYSTYRGS
ncbi:MAG: hydroxyisourate hydrolase [Candidatus Azobacteroides sp.]|nr:hydroxyisourate hydrolase [Candidatus Azobacteroides sp.]